MCSSATADVNKSTSSTVTSSAGNSSSVSAITFFGVQGHLVARACALFRMLVACLLNTPYYKTYPMHDSSLREGPF